MGNIESSHIALHGGYPDRARQQWVMPKSSRSRNPQRRNTAPSASHPPTRYDPGYRQISRQLSRGHPGSDYGRGTRRLPSRMPDYDEEEVEEEEGEGEEYEEGEDDDEGPEYMSAPGDVRRRRPSGAAGVGPAPFTGLSGPQRRPTASQSVQPYPSQTSGGPTAVNPLRQPSGLSSRQQPPIARRPYSRQQSTNAAAPAPPSQGFSPALSRSQSRNPRATQREGSPAPSQAQVQTQKRAGGRRDGQRQRGGR